MSEKNMRIIKVKSNKQLNDFIAVPRHVYKDTPQHIMRPDLEMRDHLGAKNPFYEHADIDLFVAYDNDRPAGRISVHNDRNNPACTDDKTGHFGFMEAETAEILAALLEHAAQHLKAKGFVRMAGPYSFSTNDECGLLIEGYDLSPRLMMNYAHPFYADVLAEKGFLKAKDLLAFDVDAARDLPRAVQFMARQSRTIEGYQQRSVNSRALEDDLGTIMTIFNDAWSENWGYVPMNDAEIRHTAKALKPIIVTDMAQIAFIKDKAVAMVVALPDVNEALSGLKGRLFPFGVFKLLWRLKIKGVKTARVLLMGVTKDLKGTPLSASITASLVSEIQENLKKRGYDKIEMSWILEDNKAMIRMIQTFGGKISRRYRLYEKQIGS